MKRSDIKAATHAGTCKCKRGEASLQKKKGVSTGGDMEKGGVCRETRARHITEQATFNALIGWC